MSWALEATQAGLGNEELAGAMTWVPAVAVVAAVDAVRSRSSRCHTRTTFRTRSRGRRRRNRHQRRRVDFRCTYWCRERALWTAKVVPLAGAARVAVARAAAVAGVGVGAGPAARPLAIRMRLPAHRMGRRRHVRRRAAG